MYNNSNNNNNNKCTAKWPGQEKLFLLIWAYISTPYRIAGATINQKSWGIPKRDFKSTSTFKFSKPSQPIVIKNRTCARVRDNITRTHFQINKCIILQQAGSSMIFAAMKLCVNEYNSQTADVCFPPPRSWDTLHVTSRCHRSWMRRSQCNQYNAVSANSYYRHEESKISYLIGPKEPNDINAFPWVRSLVF